MVGSVSTDTYKRPFSFNLDKAALTLAICINEYIPSCILAPPEAVNIINGSFSSIAFSIALVIFSPTTEPMLPIKNLLSIMQSTVFSPFTSPMPVTTASFNPVLSFKSLIFFSYVWVYFCPSSFIYNLLYPFIGRHPKIVLTETTNA